jgi:predicted acetyltransferase
MAALEFRSPSRDELRDFFEPVVSAYGLDATEDDYRYEELTYEDGRSFGALDEGVWVGGSGAYTFDVTVPGGAQVAASGVTMVGVAPTHRRRGILTTMMRWLHDDAVRRGEPLAVLTASEASIYRRFGYGVATDDARITVPSRAVVFDPPLHDDGRFRRLDPHQGTAVLEGVYEQVRLRRTGWFNRGAGWWERLRLDPTDARAGDSKLFAVVHEDASGTPDGFATWRISQNHADNRVADDTVVLDELVALDADVELAIWQFLAGIDLTTSIRWNGAPMDLPLRWRMVEPRQLHLRGRSDWMWARLLDVPAALAARRYLVAGDLVLHVDDPFHPEAAGTYRLKGSPDGAECERVDDARPDLSLGAPELGAVYLGGAAPSLYASAGRIVEHAPGALERADAMFVTHPAPYCPLMF